MSSPHFKTESMVGMFSNRGGYLYYSALKKGDHPNNYSEIVTVIPIENVHGQLAFETGADAASTSEMRTERTKVRCAADGDKF